MAKFSYTITDEVGIHARPAGLLVKASTGFGSNISITNLRNSKTADAKKLFSVLGLEAKRGDMLEIEVSGSDEEEAGSFLEGFFKDNL